MNLNTVAKANMPVILGEHEMWVGGYGFSVYAAAWALFENYPGPRDFQVGLGSQWLKPQPTGNEPEDFYTTIEGGYIRISILLESKKLRWTE